MSKIRSSGQLQGPGQAHRGAGPQGLASATAGKQIGDTTSSKVYNLGDSYVLKVANKGYEHTLQEQVRGLEVLRHAGYKTPDFLGYHSSGGAIFDKILGVKGTDLFRQIDTTLAQSQRLNSAIFEFQRGANAVIERTGLDGDVRGPNWFFHGDLNELRSALNMGVQETAQYLSQHSTIIDPVMPILRGE